MNINKIWQKKFNILLFIYTIISFISLGYPLKILAITGTYCIFYLLHQYSRRLFTLIISSVGLLGALYLPQAIIYGSISSGIIVSLLETHPQEAKEYLLSLPLYTYLYSLLFIVFSIIIIITSNKQQATSNKQQATSNKQQATSNKQQALQKYHLYYLTIAILAILYKPIKNDAPFSLEHTRVYLISLPIKIYQNTQDYLTQKKLLLEYTKKPSTWQIQSVQPKYQTHVLVIGESMRADYLSLYGFPLNTTPFLNTTKGKIYQGYIAAAPNTYPSILYSLFQHTIHTNHIHYENNLISLSKQAGFETYWLSNQGFIGKHDTIAAILAMQTQYYYFPTKSTYNSHKVLDNNLLPQLEKILNQPSHNNRLIVLHLLGSHPSFCQRLWQPIEFQYLNKDMSCYLQTIKQTDGLLKDIVSMLSQHTSSYSLIYFSDHGLSFSSKDNPSSITLKVGNDTQQNYIVPLIMISSDDTNQERIHFHQSATNFLYGFAEWTGIHLNSPPIQSFWQGTSEPIQVYNWKKWINFDELASEPAINPE